MDGLKDCVPFRAEQSPQLDLFADIPTCAEQTDCVIKDWRSKKILKFKELKGINTMKFDFVIGNPPYQEAVGKSKTQTQGNSNWIYQYFQFEADKISNCSCLIYPFGGWFDAPERLNGLGNLILNDKRTTAVKAYEGTIDKRAWYRNDKKPEPPFGTNANLSAGVSIVIRSNQLHEFFVYFNRIYSDKEVRVSFCDDLALPPNPDFVQIDHKLGKRKLCSRIRKGLFGIESDYVEKNPNNVSFSEKTGSSLYDC